MDLDLNRGGLSNGQILLRCAVWMVGVKLFTMVVGHIASGGLDAFDPNTWIRATDIPHYMDIAREGYVSTGEHAMWIVFLPLYPYTLGALGAITGEYFWTGSLLSMAYLVVAGFYLFKLVRADFGERQAKRTLKYLMLFPTIFFAMLPMSEGLFLMLSAMFLYYLRQGKMLLAGILGALAAFTRSVGVVLVLPLIMEAYQRTFQEGFQKKLFGRWVKKSLPALIIPLGTIAYLLINYIVFGDFFKFQYYQQLNWSQGLTFFWNTLNLLMDNLQTYDLLHSIALWLSQLVFIFWGMVMLILSARWRAMYSFFSFPVLVYSISATWLLSAPRYLMAMLPCIMEMGLRAEKRWVDWTITATETVLLAALTANLVMVGMIY